MLAYLQYWGAMLRHAFTGSRTYLAWLCLLGLGGVAGALSYAKQASEGLIVTNMTDQVSWGAYIANFTFLVGIAAAAVLLVVPTYVYGRKDVKEVVLVGELMAVSAIVMCLMFVIVDLGRPDRLMHMLPGLGRLNFPRSILAWDVVVLSGYLLLNLHIPGYVLYQRYFGRRPSRIYYTPLALLSILWAVSIHTVTAFLYSGLGGRPIWNTAILAPRFLVSAFASGPALLIIVLTIVRRTGAFPVQPSVIEYLRRIISLTLPLNYFLLGCELFSEFYTDSAHALSAEYLYFGLHGHAELAPYIWGGLLLGLSAMGIIWAPRLRSRPRWLMSACAMVVVGVWVEKGMGLIIPGFIPSPAGDLVEYSPSLVETLVSFGIWCTGALVFTAMVKVALAIERGDLRRSGVGPQRLSSWPARPPDGSQVSP
ncbi:MAG: polysulfide reductase NrfD [Myxococcales bacterium]|nr:polysulfide reductase NrfD [Myxococcales bacterium]MDD9965485.1 polysulfide reductase NrfD [Myxococcales bacterium]